MAKVAGNKRSSKKTKTLDLDPDKIQKMIKDAKDGKSSRSAKINKKNLESYEKLYKKALDNKKHYYNFRTTNSLVRSSGQE